MTRESLDSWWTGPLESGLVPTGIVRAGIRRLCATRLREEDEGDPALQLARLMRHAAALKASPIALVTETPTSSTTRSPRRSSSARWDRT